jgi:hypothetical protein
MLERRAATGQRGKYCKTPKLGRPDDSATAHGAPESGSKHGADAPTHAAETER